MNEPSEEQEPSNINETLTDKEKEKFQELWKHFTECSEKYKSAKTNVKKKFYEKKLNSLRDKILKTLVKEERLKYMLHGENEQEVEETKEQEE